VCHCDCAALFSHESRASTSWASVPPVCPLPCPSAGYRIAHSNPQHHFSLFKSTPTLLRHRPRTIHLLRHNILCPNVPQTTPLNNPPDTILCPGYNVLPHHVVFQHCSPIFWPPQCTLLLPNHYHNSNARHLYDNGNASGLVHSGSPPGLPSVRAAGDQRPLWRVRCQNPSYPPTTIRIRTNPQCR